MNLIAYWQTYKADARQLAFVPLARQWHALDVDPHDAAQWANRGFLPHEAEPLIADGVTPDLVGAVESAIGDGDELAALTLDLHRNGETT